MALIIAAISVSFGFVTVCTALPVRLSREAMSPRSHITVSQMPQTGFTTYTRDTQTASCISIPTTLVPTAVKLSSGTGSPGSYRLLGFSSDCPISEATDDSHLKILEPFDNDGRPIILNKRNPICSFRLGKNPSKEVSVTFVGENPGEFPNYKKTVSNNRSCHDLCSSPSPWAKYAQSVEIISNGIPANNYIQVFSDSQCQDDDAEVRHGANLIEMTRQDPANVVRSFIVVNEDDKKK